MSKKGVPFLPNLEEELALGMKNGKPIKWGCQYNPNYVKEGMKIFFRLVDEQQAVNRFEWKNLPLNLTSQELERLVYYRGQLAFFKMKDLDEYYIMPYALDGDLDFYGRFNRVHPLPICEAGEDDPKAKMKVEAQRNILSQIKLTCIYNENQIKEDMNKDELCVLLHDYTKQRAESIVNRKTVNEPIIDVMSDIVPFLRTAMIGSVGIKGMRVNDADSSEEVAIASNKLYQDAISGKLLEAITSAIEFQELTDSKGQGRLQEFLFALQSLDNLRLSGYGLDNGGVFEKKSHMLQEEQQTNSNNSQLVLNDGLEIRKNFCNLINKIWGLNVEVNIRQTEENTEIVEDGNSPKDVITNKDMGGGSNEVR